MFKYIIIFMLLGLIGGVGLYVTSLQSDCEMSEWNEWSKCSAECAGGTQTRTRTIKKQSVGGKDCPSQSETRKCNTQACPKPPIDCEVGAWSGWTKCSEECAGGIQTRNREAITDPAHGGKACPALFEQRECNTDPCPVDCVVSEWGKWSKCSKDCARGVQGRRRTVTTQPAYGGEPCPHQHEQRHCNTQPCPIDCKMSEWEDIGYGCRDATFQPVRCGAGLIRQKRHVVNEPYYGGKPCETQLERSIPCSENKDCMWKTFKGQCPKGWRGANAIECQLTEMMNRTGNLVEIGAETRKEWRTDKPYGCALLGNSMKSNILHFNPNPNGKPDAYSNRVCRKIEEPEDCELNEWSDWVDSPDSYTQYRTRTIKKPRSSSPPEGLHSELKAWEAGEGAYGGKACPDENSPERKQIVDKVDCKLSDWSKWMDTSDGKKKYRIRSILTNPAYNGKACPDKNSKERRQEIDLTKKIETTSWNGGTILTKAERWPYKLVTSKIGRPPAHIDPTPGLTCKKPGKYDPHTGRLTDNIFNTKLIDSPEECLKAAQHLGITDRTTMKYAILNTKNHPPGCFYQATSINGGRTTKGTPFYNTKTDHDKECGDGAQYSSQCICKLE